MNTRPLSETSDTVSLVCALLVRYPEIASIRSMPGEGTVRLSFAVGQRIDRATQSKIVEEIHSHAEGLLSLIREGGEIRVECESDRRLSFVHITRDLYTFTREELAMTVQLLGQRFGAALVRNPLPDAQADEDPSAQDELVEAAIEALRDPSQSRNLVGFHEEKQVLVYFLKSQKKAKASARR